MDGSGGPPFVADVLVRGDRVVAVAPELATAGAQELDCTDLVVCPGFIDTHSHSDLRLLHGDPPRSRVGQGITTEILGQDGLSVAPVAPRHARLANDLVAGLLGSYPDLPSWPSITAYLQALQRHGMPVNAAMLVPHGMVRLAVKDMDASPASPAELEAMAEVLDDCLEQGGLGLSTGLVYPPCAYAETRELEALAAVAARHGRPLVVHLRSEGRHIIPALQEMIAVAQATGVQLHISHFMVTARANWHLLEPLLEHVEAARAGGVSLTCDQYPYQAGCTVFTALLPFWSMEGGVQALLERLQDPGERQRIHDAITGDSAPDWESRLLTIGAENVVLSSAQREQNRRLEGRSLAQIAEAWGVGVVDALLDLILQEQGRATMIMHHLSDQVVESIMRLPYVMCCTDGIYGGTPHPRLYGAFVRRLAVYTRDRQLLDLQTAIHGMTGLPADTFSLADRGRLAVGKVADIVVLSLEQLDDRASYQEPRQHPAGIHHVLVGGQFVLEAGSFTGRTPGRALRPQAPPLR